MTNFFLRTEFEVETEKKRMPFTWKCNLFLLSCGLTVNTVKLLFLINQQLWKSQSNSKSIKCNFKLFLLTWFLYLYLFKGFVCYVVHNKTKNVSEHCANTHFILEFQKMQKEIPSLIKLWFCLYRLTFNSLNLKFNILVNRTFQWSRYNWYRFFYSDIEISRYGFAPPLTNPIVIL